MNVGKITQVLGPVVDARFDADHLPEIRTALKITRRTGGELVCEVQQHLGNNTVRTVALSAQP